MEKFSNRGNVVKLVARRELKSTFYGLGVYAIMTFSFLMASFMLKSTISSVVNNGLMVFGNPLNYPLFIAVVIGASYLALCSAISISRERDQGTLEVLFYGPVDSVSYILGKYGEQMISFLGMMVFYLIYFYVMSVLTNLGFTGSFLQIVVLSVFLASCMVGFGILLSSITRSVRTSIVIFLGLVAFFLAFDIVHSIIMSMPGKDLSTFLIYARVGLQYVNYVIEWLSPFAYLQRGITAVNMMNAGRYLLSILFSLIYTGILLSLAVIAFNRKGVKK